MKFPLAFWPGAFDIVEDCVNFVVRQYLAENGHVALVTRDEGSDPLLGDREQLAIGVVPGVATRIVRRGGQSTGVQRPLPVRLAFEVFAMAGRAVRGVKRLPESKSLRGEFLGAGRRHSQDGNHNHIRALEHHK